MFLIWGPLEGVLEVKSVIIFQQQLFRLFGATHLLQTLVLQLRIRFGISSHQVRLPLLELNHERRHGLIRINMLDFWVSNLADTLFHEKRMNSRHLVLKQWPNVVHGPAKVDEVVTVDRAHTLVD